MAGLPLALPHLPFLKALYPLSLCDLLLFRVLINIESRVTLSPSAPPVLNFPVGKVFWPPILL